MESDSTDTIGLPALKDMIKELGIPARDPRPAFKIFAFAEHGSPMEDLRQGMRLPGIVTYVTAFGAFVDICVYQDGLVPISHLAASFVKNPAYVVRVQQAVIVTALDVEL